MDVVELIKKDHDHVEVLFSRFKGGGGLTGLVRRVTGNVPPRQQRSALDAICRELEMHTRLEEEIFYPAVRATGDGELNRLVGESLKEHERVKQKIQELRQHPDGEDLDSRVNALEQDVQHHVNEEEGEMLPRVEQVMPEGERAKLGRRMQERKRAAGTTRRRATRRTTRRATGTRQARAASRKRRVPAASRKRRAPAAGRGRRQRGAAGQRGRAKKRRAR